MKVNLEYQSALDFFGKELNDIKESMYSQRRNIIRDCAKVTKAAVIKNMPVSDVDKPLYKHMKDDVKVTIKDDQEGEIVAIIGGGKDTAYKWHLVDNGTTDTPAAHFTDKSLKDTEGDHDAIMSNAIFKAVDR